MIKIASAVLVVGLSLLPGVARSQTSTDCNQLARDTIKRDFQSSWSEYSKLLFLSMVSQMSVQEGQEALSHSGEVGVGPIKIGPGTWNEDKRNSLRTELQKYFRIDTLTASAASVVSSSGDAKAEEAIKACIQANSVAQGGFFATLKDKSTDLAVIEVLWAAAPRESNRTVKIDDITIDPDHGRLVGTALKSGTILNDRLSRTAQIKRNPTKDLLVTMNLKGGGAVDVYVPPSVLPPPPEVARRLILGQPTGIIGSGGHFDGFRNPGCQAHSKESCVVPQLGGKIVKGTGKPQIASQIGRGGTSNEKETEDRYCVTFWAATGACEQETSIEGVATAIEEYPVKTFEPGKTGVNFLENTE